MTANTPTETRAAQQEITLLDMLLVLAAHKKLVFRLPIAVALLTAGITLLLPNIYTATTRILPPQQQQSSAAAMLGQLGALAGGAASALGIKNPNDLYVGMLKSRTVADDLIRRFELKQRFDVETLDEARKELEKVSEIIAGKDGIISVAVDDEEPKIAADLANAYVEELSKITTTLAVTEASQRRLFFEQQLKQTKDNLASAEVELKKSQETTGLIQLDEQAKALIEAVAQLRAQIAAKEVELGAMRTFATERNPDYIRTREQLAGLRVQLARMETASLAGDGNVLVPTGKVPEAGLEYIRKLREVKYQETVFELLARQFEIAKSDEAKDVSTIQILDHAVPPEKKSKPRRSLIVVLALLASGFLAALLAFLSEGLRRAEADPEQASKLARLRSIVAGNTRLGAIWGRKGNA